MPGFRLQSVPYHHPDATVLTDMAQQFYTEIYGSPDTAPVADTEFAAPLGHFMVGYLDEEPVTMGGWRFSDVELAGATRPAELKRMFVRADVRRLGLALRTLQALEDSARNAGADWLILEAGLPQVAALAFYRAAGYVDIPKFGYYAGYPNSVSLGRSLAHVRKTLR